MCISLCLKTNRWLMTSLATYIFKQTDLCTLSTIKRNSLSFCRYNKAFGVGVFFGDLSASVVNFIAVIAFSIFLEMRPTNFTYGGIRALTIANLASSAYGLYSYFV